MRLTAGSSQYGQLSLLENFILLFRTIPTDIKENSGCWSSEAGTQDAARQSLFIALQSLVCLHPSVAFVLSHGTEEVRLTEWTLSRKLQRRGRKELEELVSVLPASGALYTSLRLPGSSTNKEQINLSCVYFYSLKYSQISEVSPEGRYPPQNIT